jgi:Translin-associated factor X-interacting N-terminus
VVHFQGLQLLYTALVRQLAGKRSVQRSASADTISGKIMFQQLPARHSWLQAMLQQKLDAAATSAATYGLLRTKWAESTLRLDAHRQVFEVLIISMATYKPVLLNIRRQYDESLDEALKASYERNLLQADLAEAGRKQADAVNLALEECATSALKLRQQMLAQLADTEAKALEAEAAADAAELSAVDAQQQLAHVYRKARELKAENLRLQISMQKASTWAQGNRCWTFLCFSASM